MKTFEEFINEGWKELGLSAALALGGSDVGHAQQPTAKTQSVDSVQVNLMSSSNKREIPMTITVYSKTRNAETVKRLEEQIKAGMRELRKQINENLSPEFVKNGGVVTLEYLTDESGKVITNNKGAMAHNFIRAIPPKHDNGKFTMKVIVNVGYYKSNVPAKPEEAFGKKKYDLY